MVLASLLLMSCTAGSGVLRETAHEGIEPFASAFFADRKAGHMKELRIPGLVVAAVQDGQVVLLKGYGQASIEEKLPVDPEHTVFRIGSVSKLFVAVAVMQLVEQGKLDLSADVNQYLTAFQVENPFPEPITVEHLLSHTSGLQDPPYATTADHTARVPLEECLAQELPPPTTPPGKQFAYSSYGVSLAAYIVQQVAGVPFDQYLTDEVLEPLGMHQTVYLLSPEQSGGLATGYFPRRARYEMLPLDYDDDYPSGSLVSTGHDMAIFIQALLGDGCVEDRCILGPGTIAEMHVPRARTPSESLMQGLGFVVGDVEGLRVVGHTGAIKGFGSSLDLYPDANVGTYIAFNAECWESDACAIIGEFRQAIIGHMLSN